MPFGWGEHWVKAQGLVVASREIGSKGLGTWREEWVVEVHAQDGEVFRSPIKWPLVEHDDFSFIPCSVGATVRIEYDPKNHNLRWDKSDRARNLLAKTPAQELAQQDDAFKAALAGRTTQTDSVTDPDLAELEAATQPGGFNVAFDASGRPSAGEVAALVGGVQSGAVKQIHGSAAQTLATGIHGTAVITTTQPLGKTVRDINPNADPSRLNDPMWLFTVEATVPGEAPFPAVFGHRVPMAKIASLAPGVKLAVAVDMADHNKVAIDWDKSPVVG